MTALLSAADLRGRAVFDLATHGPRTAFVGPDGAVSYADLVDRVDAFAHDVLGGQRRLVLVEGANDPDSLVAYLAALQHGHAVLMVPDAAGPRGLSVVDRYDPDVLVRRGEEPVVRRHESAHDLHPDLSLLLSTSGSTGSPKLVRLSADNLRANAESIAAFLHLTEDDRAATSLPMHYCYGLSVVHSHLTVGASLLLAEGSVVDRCFWDAFDDAKATSFAGVPFTFELLESSGFADRRHPSLRYVTQAGGRLEPDLVRRYAALGERDGWDLVVMYGQTEATARMAYLPPELAARRPEAIGVPIPGGDLRVDPADGELVYTGPNVMLGYAEGPGDLALGRTVTELRTGDLGRWRDGLLEVTGRKGRHTKLFGLRIDLDRVEELASTTRTPVWCVASGDRLHAFTTRPRAGARVRARVAAAAGIPARCVVVTLLGELPRTPSGKPDRPALLQQAALVAAAARPPATASDPAPDPASDPASGPATADDVRDELATVLGRPDARVDSTFVSLGGDSLSYVELSTRLARRLGDLPADWHTRTAAELASGAGRARRGVRLDTTVLLRALAIVAVVGSHADLFTVTGGAHLLLALAGYNFARFQLADVPRRTRVRHGLASVAHVVVPSALFIGLVGVVTDFYDLRTAVFLNGLLGSDRWTDQWQFWFLEALVWVTLAMVALAGVPAVDAWERRSPFAVAAVVVAAALVVRFAWVGVQAGPTERYTVGIVAWCFAMGWMLERARSTWQRTASVVAAAVGVLGFFGDLPRELLVVVGVAALAFLPTVQVPVWLASPLSLLATSSLFVYLTHWQVYPHLEPSSPALATVASFAAGFAFWWATRPGLRRLSAWSRGRGHVAVEHDDGILGAERPPLPPREGLAGPTAHLVVRRS